MNSHNAFERSLRQQLRQLRRTLPPPQRAKLEQALCRRLWHYPPLRYSQRIALYLANDGEPALTSLIEQLWQHGKELYLPHLYPLPHRCQLGFSRFTPQTRLQPNRFGILEPCHIDLPHRREQLRLDLVLMPLVGFHPKGTRLGMGKGYYDRTFSYRARQSALGRPKLIGVAFEFQKVAQLPRREWDIPADTIITDSHCYHSSPPTPPPRGG
ncbi:5-formyltetrahydrofolate cyclo-ligase [Ectothiorhodospiraceae bacterium BW-2]|nr:5-formyltetrahydrofolate cyclo-ligase [Ectothiorhodospiraceae bacterium BW-2]